MSKVDIDHLRAWIGRQETSEDLLSARHARLMAATMGIEQTQFVDGAPLPPLWHWIYFLEGLPPERLGRDGHPQRGGFLPPVPLENRMWAGGNVKFHATVRLGSVVQKRSTIQSVEYKQGRSGELVFVTVLHEVLSDGNVAIEETHDIVYKDPSPPGATASKPELPQAEQGKSLTPTSTTLFRYSALTFNGHRIHYDVDYCRDVEGYPNLVIHGPLNATLLANYAQEILGRPIREFRYRGLQPSFIGDVLRLNAAAVKDGLTVWVDRGEGRISMHADAR